MNDDSLRELERRALDGDVDALLELRRAWLRLGAAGVVADEPEKLLILDVREGFASSRRFGDEFEVVFGFGTEDRVEMTYSAEQTVDGTMPEPGSRVVAYMALVASNTPLSRLLSPTPRPEATTKDLAIAAIVGHPPSRAGEVVGIKADAVAVTRQGGAVEWTFRDSGLRSFGNEEGCETTVYDGKEGD